MPKDKVWYYAVARGRVPGIYFNWTDCKQQVDKFPDCRYKKFDTVQEADLWIKQIQSGEKQ
jgi:viroplasmin and RNaseH domain-containing protein